MNGPLVELEMDLYDTEGRVLSLYLKTSFFGPTIPGIKSPDTIFFLLLIKKKSQMRTIHNLNDWKIFLPLIHVNICDHFPFEGLLLFMRFTSREIFWHSSLNSVGFPIHFSIIFNKLEENYVV